MVLLHSGEASQQERRGFDAWLMRDERHRTAWQHLTGPVANALDPIRTLNQHAPGQAYAMADAMADAKSRVQRRRRVLRGALALGGVSSGAVALLQRFDPLQNAFADFHTATGQRQRFELADGSVLVLNARSAADVKFTPTRRQVSLRMGALIAEVQPDLQRPFCVSTAFGDIQALNSDQQAKFLVRNQQDDCVVAALDQALQITPKQGAQVRLPPGSVIRLSNHGINPTFESAASAAAWESGRVAVYDQPLGEVIEAMRPYRAGLLRISSAAASLKVYGSYPLDDTDEALRSIAETLPVYVHVHSAGWLVRIELA